MVLVLWVELCHGCKITLKWFQIQNILHEDVGKPCSTTLRMYVECIRWSHLNSNTNLTPLNLADLAFAPASHVMRRCLSVTQSPNKTTTNLASRNRFTIFASRFTGFRILHLFNCLLTTTRGQHVSVHMVDFYKSLPNWWSFPVGLSLLVFYFAGYYNMVDQSGHYWGLLPQSFHRIFKPLCDLKADGPTVALCFLI